MTPESKQQMKMLKLFVYSAIGLFVITALCAGTWTINNLINSKRIIDAQVKVYEVQAENVGKPIRYEQYYHSPQDL